MSRAESNWDAIVVGGGVGGLTCAAYLAANGRRVLVLEQHEVVGGNAHSFRRRRAYEFDVGVHYLGDCGPGGLLPTILGGLGLRDWVSFRPMDQDGFDRIVLPGYTVDVPAGWDRYRDRVAAVFPGEAGAIARFAEICQAVAAVNRRDAAPATTDPAGAPVRPATNPWQRRTLSELFDHLGLSTPVRTVLAAQGGGNYGLAPRAVTVAAHVRMLDHYLRGAYYPEGGGHTIVAALVSAIESHGSEIWTRSPVRRVHVEQGRAAGVTLADGRRIRARVVVSNADYRRTVLDLVEPGALTDIVVKRASNAEQSLGCVVLYVALDRPLPDRPNANLWWYAGSDIEAYFDRLHRGEFDGIEMLFGSFASIKDPHSRTLCPPGHSNFQLITMCPPGYGRWGVPAGPADGVRYRRLDTYQREKERVTAAMLATAERAIGPFRDSIVHLETATPLSQERYTWSTGGTPYGLARWGSNPAARPDTRTTVDGLYAVGQNTLYGSGVAGVMFGGITCAGQILDRQLMAEVGAGAVFGDPSLLPDRTEDWDPLVVSRGAAQRVRRRPGPRFPDPAASPQRTERVLPTSTQHLTRPAAAGDATSPLSLVDTRSLATAEPVVGAAHRIYEHLIGLWAPGVIEAAFDLDVFGELAAAPGTAAELSQRLDTDPRGMRVLLDALSAYQMVERRSGGGEVSYSLPDEVRDCVLPDGLFSLAGKMRYDRMLAWDAWRNLASAVRGAGRGGDQPENHNQISDLEYESLVRGINFWAPPIVGQLAGALAAAGWDGEPQRSILDVGCGTGLYCQLLLNRFPNASAVGLDVARIAPIAQAQAEQMDLGSRFRPTVSDFWEQDWGTGFDLVLFVNIFHLQTAASAQDLAMRASKALADGGVVAIVDQIVDDRSDTAAVQDRFFRLFAASMLATGGGDAYPLSDYDEWLSAAGLQRVELIDTPMHRILLARHA